ncbi:MAG: rhomboid family intramembrane serine protease [Chthoniobacteraceae bacterium]|nr:rhomboid family intramembrane serine protease [Chthoniobacteraceae bacterium]
MTRSSRELVRIGCYLRQDQADERGLVILALERPYWILEEDGLYGLYVDAADAEAASGELEKFEQERAADLQRAREAALQDRPAGKRRETPLFSLFVYVWTLCLFYGVQATQGAPWTDRGIADSAAILHGQLWRIVTALTLHADLGHLFANLTVGLVFAWALLPLLGSGWTWLGLVWSGALGNALNAVVHGGSHLSLGASTGVFGGLGLLVAYQIAAILRPGAGAARAAWRWRDIGIPLAAGFALLAYLGVGDGNGNIDVLAHGFGMAAGLATGFLLGWTRLPQKTTPRVQTLLALAALLLPALAWLWALC